MARKKAHNPIYRGVFMVLSILFMWGFGISLLLVIMNISIGFADNEADFRRAFLEWTESHEMPELEDYLRTYVESKEHPGDYEAALNSYANKFDPKNTNLRFTATFSATDQEEELILQNDPTYSPQTRMLVSDVQMLELQMGMRNYMKPKHFNNPITAYSEIIYGDNSQYLDDPSDYSIWYFADNDVDYAYHHNVSVKVFTDPYTETRVFRSEAEAAMYDYTAEFGELCDWEIVKDPENVPAADAQDENGTGVHEGNDGSVTVRVQAYATYKDMTVTMEEYYDMKVNGTQVVASDPELERKLMSGLDIKIFAEHMETKPCRLLVYLPETMEVQDSIRANYTVYHSLFRHGEWAVIIMFIFLVLTVIVCIVMCTAAGYTGDSGEVRASRVHSIIYELFWLLPCAALILSGLIVQLLFYVQCSYRLLTIFSVGMILVIATTCVLWLYTTAIRAKMGTFWSSFGFYRLFRYLISLFRNSTTVVLAAVLYAVILFILNALVVPGLSAADFGLYLIVVLDLLTLIAIAYCIYSYFELHRHVRQMETGDFSPAEHPVPLTADFSRFDRSLNEITDRVEDIVAKQTKAEHLRTELITNVSHDLKTPLTSIVNYVDLLSREPMQTDTAAEYLEVLQRQAARLKKLTIDLVDASKASTGNLTVELMPTDIRVLLSQLAGEYEEQLEKRDLTLMQNMPDDALTILADGRQIWRVFDNLLNNACKYALGGTRVYLDVRRNGETVEITVKNISAAPLNISADQLMERFVRGDASRHTEGSGLGLSIAKDLTALQNGVLELQTDGDLFKAILRFPIYHAPDEQAIEEIFGSKPDTEELPEPEEP
ncbi:MAG: hypothetical protein J5722_02930 [Oscillospiraceae bacterium]|nr:hypothetical protein [Oscillospiraceae bacterium]